VFLVASFSVVAFVSWKGLHKSPEHPSFVLLPFVIIVAAMLAKWLVSFTCFRERLVFVLIIVSMVTGQVTSFAPSVFGQYIGMAKYGKLALSLLGLIVSLTMLVPSARSPNVGPSNAEALIAWQPKQKLLILLVVTLTVLALGAMLYFLPFQH
jgi:hypothetical protein